VDLIVPCLEHVYDRFQLNGTPEALDRAYAITEAVMILAAATLTCNEGSVCTTDGVRLMHAYDRGERAEAAAEVRAELISTMVNQRMHPLSPTFRIFVENYLAGGDVGGTGGTSALAPIGIRGTGYGRSVHEQRLLALADQLHERPTDAVKQRALNSVWTKSAATLGVDLAGERELLDVACIERLAVGSELSFYVRALLSDRNWTTITCNERLARSVCRISRAVAFGSTSFPFARLANVVKQETRGTVDPDRLDEALTASARDDVIKEELHTVSLHELYTLLDATDPITQSHDGSEESEDSVFLLGNLLVPTRRNSVIQAARVLRERLSFILDK
jgi:hypothetical protein